jgi:asparagine synthase (glutamine-hydrolysing)
VLTPDGNWRTQFAPTAAALRAGGEGAFRCLLGHNWLAIQDTNPRARQPMFRGELAVVLNGEIYNFVELREELQSSGSSFLTTSDTEVLLELWRREGSACIPRLRGMFAFLLYDRNLKKLWAVRDPFGIKPLYYRQDREGLYFSSEMRALHAGGGFPKRIRQTAVIAAVAAGVNKFGDCETFYEDVLELPAGCIMEVDDSGRTLQRYYSLPQVSQDLEGEEAIGALLEALEESCRLHLRSSRRVASCLSGGLDSSNLAMLIGRNRHLAGGDFSVFSIHSGSEENSELPLARAVASAAQLRHETFRYSGIIEMADALQMVVAYEQPNHVIGPINQMLLLRHIAEEGISVVLDGQGGDELVSGYTWFWPVLADTIETNGGDRQVLWNQRLTKLPFPLPTIQLYDRIFHDPRAWLEAFVGEGFLGYSREALSEMPEVRYYLGDASGWQAFREREYYRGSLALLLRQEDRLGMWFGLECRVPYVDRLVVDVASRLKPGFLIGEGYLKYPLRLLPTGLPESVRWNTTKRGFWDTHQDRFAWLRGKGRELALGSGLLRTVFPGLESGWDALSDDQRWRALQVAVLECAATREELGTVH